MAISSWVTEPAACAVSSRLRASSVSRSSATAPTCTAPAARSTPALTCAPSCDVRCSSSDETSKMPHYACRGGRAAIGRSAHISSLLGPSLRDGVEEPSGLLRIDGFRLFGDREAQLRFAFPRLPRPDEQEPELKADDGGLRELAGERP